MVVSGNIVTILEKKSSGVLQNTVLEVVNCDQIGPTFHPVVQMRPRSKFPWFAAQDNRSDMS